MREKDLTLTISKRIRDILVNEYDGVDIQMSRTGDTFPSLNQRTTAANNWGADFFLSVHINSGGGTGFESYVSNNVGTTTKSYQNIIHAEIMKEIDMRDRGKKQQGFHVIRVSNMPALLTENGFIDTASDANKMKDAAWLEKVARSHVNGLAKAFNLKRKAVNPSAEEEVRVVERDINVVSDWAKDDWEEATRNGYFDGTRPGAPLTREEAAIVINRLRRNLLDLMNQSE